MSGESETPYFGAYPADFFDFIVVDECHRGSAAEDSAWREILQRHHAIVRGELAGAATAARHTELREWLTGA